MILRSFLLCIALSVTHVWGQSFPPKAFLVCGDTKVLVVDYHGSSDREAKVIWEWDSSTAPDLTDAERRKFRSMDDCKLVQKGQKLLASSSSGAIALIDIRTKKVEFKTDVANAHSIDFLPEGRIAAAASTAPEGNALMLFNPSGGTGPVYSDSLYSGHGAVWDAGRERLFALGYSELRQYRLLGDSLVPEKKWTIPGIGGHELFLSPDGRFLFVTEHHGAWKFDIAGEKFSKIEGFPEAENIKSLGQDKEGQYIFTVPEESWWTFHVSFFQPGRKIPFPGLKVYKARWAD